MSNCRKEDSTCGVKLIWLHMNHFCSYTRIFSGSKIQIRFLSITSLATSVKTDDQTDTILIK